MRKQHVELTTTDLDLPISALPDSQIAKLAQRSFLPFVKLIGTSSKEAESGNTRPGTYVLQRDDTNKVDLTGSFEALVIAMRSVACRKTMTSVLRYYDMDHEEYKKIEVDAAKKGNMGAWHGPEYLIWVRAQRAWATYHASSETARGRSSELTTTLKNWAAARQAKKAAIQADPAKGGAIVVPNPQVTFKCSLVFYRAIGKNQWAPTFAPCTTPFSEVPSFEETREQSIKFQSPPKSEQQTITPGADAAAEESRG